MGFQQVGRRARPGPGWMPTSGYVIDDLDRACSITEVQKKKLKLAGLGDIKRYYDRVEDLKRKYTSSAKQGNINNNIWQEMQPLQIELNNGVFDDDSIFVKTVKNTLSGDQVSVMRT